MSETIAPKSSGRRRRAEDIPILFLHGVERHYRQGDATLEILNGAELAVWPGQSVALVAPSGAGKSTLLHIAGLLEHPDGGEVYHRRPRDRELPDAERTRIRRNEIGFVYQSIICCRNSPRSRTCMLPQMIRGPRRARGEQARGRAADLSRPRRAARRTGRRNSPAASSSASRSRARSPMRRASCWPTSRPAISTRTPPTTCSRRSPQLVRASGLAAIIATHNMDLAARMDRRVTFGTGRSSSWT